MVSIALVMFLFFATNVVGNENRTTDLDESRILLQLSSSFLISNDDFLVSRRQSTFFPLTNAKAVNKRLGRYNFNNINSEEHEDKITGSLRTWRGFPDLSKNPELPFVDLLLTTFSKLFPTQEDDLPSLGSEEIQALATGCQYLLPSQVYSTTDPLELANLVNKSPGNNAMLFKMAIALRNANNSKKQKFMNAINLSWEVQEDLGYIIGYRWSVADEVSASVDNDLELSSLVNVPSDVVMDISMPSFETLNLSKKLEDKSVWEHVSQQGRVAWYTLFDKYMGWQDVGGTPYHVVKHGHLMSGAPLERLKALRGQQHVETSLLAEMLVQTPMDPIRVSFHIYFKYLS